MENRVTELEIRLTHLEETIEILNQTIIDQHKDHDKMAYQIDVLEKRIKTMSESNIAKESEETPPPHY